MSLFFFFPSWHSCLPSPFIYSRTPCWKFAHFNFLLTSNPLKKYLEFDLLSPVTPTSPSHSHLSPEPQQQLANCGLSALLSLSIINSLQNNQSNFLEFTKILSLSCSKTPHCETTLVAQWSRLHTPKAGGTGSITGWGTKIPCAEWCS